MNKEAVASTLDANSQAGPTTLFPPSKPPRLFVIGGPGSGKSWLAEMLADAKGVPVFHLDDIAREGGGNGPERPVANRMRSVAEIREGEGWVVEGIYLGWTDDLMLAADKIIWLDHLTWRGALRRIAGRFARNAVHEMRRQRGWRKVLRFRDYRRHLGQLLAAVPATRSYYVGHEDSRSSAPLITRGETQRHLQRYRNKVVHARTSEDLHAILVSGLTRD